MSLKRGSRGSEVTDLQKKLKAAGYDPGPIDGIFGPKTEAAVRAYQQAFGLTVDGIAGPQTMGSLNGDEAVDDTSQTDYTDDSLTRFNGLPGEPEIWKNTDTGQIYVMYTVPGDPPVPLLYTVPNETVAKTYFGDKPMVFDRELSSGEMAKYGSVVFGDVAELKAQSGDPWAGFEAKMEKAKRVMPWLEDDEVYSVFAAAYLEGREVEEWELKDLGWFKGKTDAEVAWATKMAQDPEDAERLLADNTSKVYALFTDLGVPDPPSELVEYLANQWTTGVWSESYARDQIMKVTGGGENVELDAGLSIFMTENEIDVATGTVGLDRVRELYAEWLGPAYIPDDTELARWAGRLRDDPQGGEARLVESLRTQRLALFPEYEDATLTWKDIAAPWKALATNTWGVPVDESDPEFQNIVRMNNATEANKELRRIGVDRGYEAIVADLANGMRMGMRSNVRGAV